MDGDILVVDRSLEVVNGRVAVVNFGSEMLCKRIFHYPDHIVLRSDNQDYNDIVINEDVGDGMNITVFGVVTAIVRELL